MAESDFFFSLIEESFILKINSAEFLTKTFPLEFTLENRRLQSKRGTIELLIYVLRVTTITKSSLLICEFHVRLHISVVCKDSKIVKLGDISFGTNDDSLVGFANVNSK